MPDDVHIDFEFDQSVYVTNAIRGLALEGALGALLTALTVLLFLRNWRSALIVVVTIPLSILSALIALRLAGQTINIMTLSGLALAVGILVDEATVAIENIHTHLATGKRAGRAVVDAMREVMQPRFLAMLCILAVFIPSFFMVGIGRALFPPLALAVGFSMIASYLLSSTLVPVLAAWLFRGVRATEATRPTVSSIASRAAMADSSRSRAAAAGSCFAALPRPLRSGASSLRGLGTELFPRVDTGQFQLRIRAPAGTRLERTEEIVRGVDQAIREEVGPRSRAHDPRQHRQPGVDVSGQRRLRLQRGPAGGGASHRAPGQRPHRPRPSSRSASGSGSAHDYPDVHFSFEAGDIVSQMLNFGAPTPIHVTVSGKNLADTRAFARARRGVPSRRFPSCATCRSPWRSTTRRSTWTSTASAPDSSGSRSIASANRSSARRRRARSRRPTSGPIRRPASAIASSARAREPDAVARGHRRICPSCRTGPGASSCATSRTSAKGQRPARSTTTTASARSA